MYIILGWIGWIGLAAAAVFAIGYFKGERDAIYRMRQRRQQQEVVPNDEKQS